MHHMLICSRDTAIRGVIISSEMSRNTTAARALQKKRKVNSSFMIDDRLRSFDHHFHFERTLDQPGLLFQQVEHVGERDHLSWCYNLRQGNNKILRQFSAGLFDQRRDENIK